MKRITALVLSLLLPMMLVLGQTNAVLADEGKQATPLLYQVTDDAGHTIYLLGTIHIGREDMYPMSDQVEAAYRDAEVLAVEIDLVDMLQNAQQALTYSMAMMYPSGDEAKNHLSPEAYALGLEKLGQPEFLLKRMQVAEWLSLAELMCYSEVDLSSDFGVDTYLLERAHLEQKPVDSLESVEAQMQLLLDMPDEIVDYQLIETLKNPKGTALSAELLFIAWRQGNEEILSLLFSSDAESVPLEFREAYAAYSERMYTERNLGFFEQAKAYLANGQKAMIAVGAAHIVGEGALADLLEKAGYHVTEIGHTQAQ